MSEMTPQHPAAPETETETNGLTVSEIAMLGDGVEHTMVALCWTPSCAGSLPWAVERIVAERVRVVEGERDAEVAEVEREHEKTLAIMEAACDRSDAATLRAESAEAAHEAEKAAHERLRAGVEALAAEVAPAIAVPDDADAYTRGMFAASQMFHRDLRSLLGGGEAR